jgi:RimJ/RimL family protein N-acetyltransferase
LHKPKEIGYLPSSSSGLGYCFSEIVIRPCVSIPKEEQREWAIGLLHKVKALCLLSRALATPQKFEIQVEISKDSLVQMMHSEIAGRSLPGEGGLTSQVQESLMDQTKSAAERPAKSESELAVGLVSRFTMKDGTEVSLRPIHPSDEPLMAQFHQTLSGRSVYMRYFRSLSLASRLAHERLVRICCVDGEREVALVVDYTNKGTRQQQILGVGRLIKLDTQNEAEVAILVSDQYQKQGLGTELLLRLIQIARDQKLHRVSGEWLRDNLAMQIIVKKLGFRFRLCAGGASIPAVLEL